MGGANHGHPFFRNGFEEAATNYSEAECIGQDPEGWTNTGTELAHALCAQCPIRTDCFRDARDEQTYGVMRANVIFPELGKGRPYRYRRDHKTRKDKHRGSARVLEDWQKWAEMRQSGMSYPQIAQAVNRNHTTIIHALKKMGAA